MMIDAHVHFTPPQLRYELTVSDEPYLQLLLSGPSSIQDWVSAETMLVDMDKAGVDKVVLVGEYFQQQANCVTRNNRVLDLINRYPDRIMAYAIVQPTAGDAALRELERCLDGGMCGLGEINPYAQGFALDSAECLALAALCADRNVPINLHVGEPVGRPYAGKSTTALDDYVQLAINAPNTKLIFAHWGGGLLFYEMMPYLRKQLANVWYDTAASPLLYPTKRIFRTALDCVAPGKLLYGSDYPLRLYPRRSDSADFAPFIAAIRELDLGATFNDAFFAQNYLDMAAQTTPTQAALPADFDTPWRQLPIRRLVATWPELADTFGRFEVPVNNQPVPSWESAAQAIAAAGLTIAQRERLSAEIDSTIAKQAPQ